MTPGADRGNEGERPPGRVPAPDLEARSEPLRRPDFWHQVVEVMSDGLSIVDRDRVIIYVNPAFCRVVGFEPEELLGMSPPYPFWPHGARAQIEQAFARTIRGEASTSE